MAGQLLARPMWSFSGMERRPRPPRAQPHASFTPSLPSCPHLSLCPTAAAAFTRFKTRSSSTASEQVDVFQAPPAGSSKEEILVYALGLQNHVLNLQEECKSYTKIALGLQEECKSYTKIALQNQEEYTTKYTDLQNHVLNLALQNQALKGEAEIAYRKLFESTYQMKVRGILMLFLAQQRVYVKEMDGQSREDSRREIWSAVLRKNKKFFKCLSESFEGEEKMVDFLVQCHEEFNLCHHQAVKRGDKYLFHREDLFHPMVEVVLACMSEQLYLNVSFQA